MDYILTNSGAVLMTQVAAGRTVIFTRVESGSGYSASPAVLQNVVDKKQDMFLDEVIFENRQAVVKTTLSNVQLEEEYQLRQVGVYGKLEGDEADTLVIIGQQYNGEKIPSYGNGIIQIEYDIAMKISGTGNVTIEGVGTGYVTKGQFLAHLSDNDNPHKVTAKQLGLENVPNVDTDDQTPTFTEAEERENIASKEKLSVLFGKIRKWFSDLKEAAFCSVANNLATTISGSVLDARQGKELQDQITGLYSDLGGFEPIIDETGKITGYKTTVGGADTVFPFSEVDKSALIEALSSSGLNINADSTPEEIYTELKRAFPGNIFSSIITTTSYPNNALWASPTPIYAWYGARYNLTGYKSITFNINYYYFEWRSSQEKYYYNIHNYLCGVALSAGSSFIRSKGLTNIGQHSNTNTMQGTVNITLDVADLEGYYYIGVSAQALNSYTGGRSEFYGGDKGIQQFTSYVRCNGVTFNK